MGGKEKLVHDTLHLLNGQIKVNSCKERPFSLLYFNFITAVGI